MTVSRSGGTSGGSLHVFDLDGTLLRSDAILSQRSLNVLNQLIDAGVLISVASARSGQAMRQLLAGLRLRLPVIELNGAFISDPATGWHLSHRLLSPEVSGTAIEHLLTVGLDPVVTSWDGRDDQVSYGPVLNSGNRWYVSEKAAYNDPRLRPLPSVATIAEIGGVATVTTFAADCEVEEVADRLRGLLGASALISFAPHPQVPGWSEVQVAHPEAQKGAAVRRLRQHCAPAVQSLTVYGDHLNDLPMFEAADWAVAPSNAHPDVLDRADLVVASNDEDGVTEHVLQEWQAASAGRTARARSRPVDRAEGTA